MGRRFTVTAIVRGVSGLSLSLALVACSTTKDPDPRVNAVLASPQPAVGLPAQTLTPGECGLFGWDTSIRPTFVFFTTAKQALYLSSDGVTKTLTPVGPFPSVDYGSLKLTLGAAEQLIAGTRYPQARVTQVLDDGYTRVRPLVILRSCQTPDQSAGLF
ncbi:hypothetical protein GCM10009069_14740 [Algimonas arctica]|uniref:Uncharacterized protein n=1 Tax=Algimonas arctica TaxID=1479486 RepID=A0A8J3CPS0_9PROT|nr:hypothetical protein [Algimonas arctica]GHA92761.1 hypothetical protein GCM10009069_14740 [Algimonas arctica]